MWDVVIIGGGLAGMMAGLRAAERGKRVIVVAYGAGSLPNASGALDFGDLAVLRSKPNHPYQILGEGKVREAYQYFLSVFPQYTGEWGRPNSVLTPLGEIRPAGLVSRWLSTRSLEQAKNIVVLAPVGMKDFFADIFRANLAQSFPESKVTSQEVRVDAFTEWYRMGKSVSALDYSRYWQSPAGALNLRGLLAGVRQAESGSTTVVVFPSLSVEFSLSIQNILADVPFPVVETTMFPPSPIGSSLCQGLQARFKALGGEVLTGGRVIGAEVQAGICRQVRVAAAGKRLSLAGKSFVLANGGLFGGGIMVGPDHVHETVFDLPLYIPEEWTRPDFLGEQPYANTGVGVDTELRPVDAGGRVVVSNVRVCGRMLAHWDPWTEHCGGGVSLASGYLAGELV